MNNGIASSKIRAFLASKSKGARPLNILITGSTGCGKSSTINALFGQSVAKVGMTPDPETMTIGKYQLDGITLWDSPGLGDGKEKDRQHAEGIVKKLNEIDADGKGLIDVALIIVDGSNRDMNTSYELINKYVIPNIESERIIVAINKADAAQGGRNWDFKESRPEPKLQKFLEDKELSVRDRIKCSTDVDIMPISYSAGFSDPELGNQEQPYNLLKLLHAIYERAPVERRWVFFGNVNNDKEMWGSNDDKEDYAKHIKDDFADSLVKNIKEWGDTGADIGREIGEKLGIPKVGETLGRIGGSVAGGIKTFVSSLWPF